MILSKEGIAKALIRLRGCAGWSAPVLFVNPEEGFLVFLCHGPYDIGKNKLFRTSFFIDKQKYYLIIFPVDQGKLELKLSWINPQDSCTTLSVQAVDVVPLDTSHIDRQVQGPDDAMVTVKDNINKELNVNVIQAFS